MPFDDLIEQSDVFRMLDDLANHPDGSARIDFQNPNTVLTRRLWILAVQINELEQEQQKNSLEPRKKSVQGALITRLICVLEDCKTTEELKTVLPDIKILLLQAWVIQRELNYHELTLLADTGIKRANELKEWSKAGSDAATRYIAADEEKWLTEATRIRKINNKLSNRALALKIRDNLKYPDTAFESIRKFINKQFPKKSGKAPAIPN